MLRFNLFNRRKTLNNHLEIRIGDILLVRISRSSACHPNNELTAVIPRLEFHIRRFENGKLAIEDTIILSGITLVDSPRHPPENTR